MVSNYDNYDYKKEFWEKSNRKYEHIIEHNTLQRCLKKIDKKSNVLMDAGCGFGRLFHSYSDFAKEFILCDFSQDMLDQAKKEIKTTAPIHFKKQDLMKLTLEPNTIDIVISVRALHHMNHPERFFSSINRVINPNGYFIIELPNQRHLLNIIKYILGRIKQNPFNKKPMKLGENFFNFHLNYLKETMLSYNFSYIHSYSTSFFRNKWFKKLIPINVLIKLDRIFQSIFSWSALTPSQFCIFQSKKI